MGRVRMLWSHKVAVNPSLKHSSGSFNHLVLPVVEDSHADTILPLPLNHGLSSYCILLHTSHMRGVEPLELRGLILAFAEIRVSMIRTHRRWASSSGCEGRSQTLRQWTQHSSCQFNQIKMIMKPTVFEIIRNVHEYCLVIIL